MLSGRARNACSVRVDQGMKIADGLICCEERERQRHAKDPARERLERNVTQDEQILSMRIESTVRAINDEPSEFFDVREPIARSAGHGDAAAQGVVVNVASGSKRGIGN